MTGMWRNTRFFMFYRLRVISVGVPAMWLYVLDHRLSVMVLWLESVIETSIEAALQTVL